MLVWLIHCGGQVPAAVRLETGTTAKLVRMAGVLVQQMRARSRVAVWRTKASTAAGATKGVGRMTGRRRQRVVRRDGREAARRLRGGRVRRVADARLCHRCVLWTRRQAAVRLVCPGRTRGHRCNALWTRVQAVVRPLVCPGQDHGERVKGRLPGSRRRR